MLLVVSQAVFRFKLGKGRGGSCASHSGGSEHFMESSLRGLVQSLGIIKGVSPLSSLS